MAILPICIVGEPVLHQPTTPVPLDADGRPSDEVVGLIDDMYETMDAAHGVGLAANQVGVGSRVFVYDCPDGDRSAARRRGEVINPVLETSEIPETMPDPDDNDEGCLSVPGEQFPTGRADWARVTGTDRTGAEVVIEEVSVEPAWNVYEQDEKGKHNVLHGGRKWSLTIDPGQEVRLEANYVIKIYANNEIIGGNRREN